MTNEELVRKAVQKAEKNGYKWAYDGMDIDIPIAYWTIFDHSFAKAFWKNYIPTDESEIPNNKEARKHYWKYHLALMVLEEEPIKYLEKFLEDDASK